MKRDLQQKAKLIELARALGQEPDPALVAEVQSYLAWERNLRSSIRNNLAQGLKKAAKKQEQPKPPITEYPQLPSLDDLDEFLLESKEEEHELVQETPQEIPTSAEPSAATTPNTVTEQSLADLVSASISQSVKRDSFQQPQAPTAAPDINSLVRKIQYLEQWIGKMSLLGPGGGASDTSNFTSFTKLVSDNYTIARKDYYVGVNHSNPVTITLPETAENGHNLVIKDESGNCSINPITVVGNVDNDPGGFILRINNGAIQMIYREGWRII
jgi:predicted DNA-binding ribbon-helix-helix protein